MKDAFRRTDEMTHIIVNVKSDKVGSQKSVQDLDPFGQNPEKFMLRKRNMVEIPDMKVGKLLTEHAWQQH